MATNLATIGQVKYALHEGRISKREAAHRIESIACEWAPEPADWWEHPTDTPQHCHKCRRTFWLNSMLLVREPSGNRAVYCSECVDYSPVTLL